MKKILPFLLLITFTGNGYSQKQLPHKKQSKKKENHVKVHHHKVHNHHHYAHLPKRGVVITSHPKGAVLIVHSGHNYHYHQGVWYKPHQGKYIVFRPCLGLRIKVLPPKHHVCVVQKKTY